MLGAILGYIDQLRIQETLFQHEGSMSALSHYRASSTLPQHSVMPSRPPCSVLKLLPLRRHEGSPSLQIAYTQVCRYNNRKMNSYW